MRRILLLLALALSIAVHAQDPNLQRGFAPGKAYDFLGLDSVSLMNGNLNVRLPLGQTYSLGPVLEYQFFLAYNSKVWEIEYAGPGQDPNLPQSWALPETHSDAGFGWNLTLGTLLPPKIHSVQGPQQGWTYLAPDGSEHEFPTVGPITTSVETIDGSYLRLRSLPDIPGRIGYHEIDFPSGIIRQFDGDGLLTEIRDRYGYKVKVTRTSTQWTVTEERPGGGTGRTHTIHVEDAPLTSDGNPYVQANFQQRPTEVNLAAFGSSTAIASYQLGYTDMKVEVGPCAEAMHEDEHYVPQLTSITLPDQSTFLMTYLATPVDRCTQATLNVLTLPTEGKIRWSMGGYELSNQACIKPRAGVLEEGWRKGHAGVRVRTLEDPNGNVIEKRTYTPVLQTRAGGFVNQRCGGGTDMWLLEKPPDVFENTVTVSAPTGPSTERVVEKTTSYFSAYPLTVDHTLTSGALVSPAKGIEYGLPFLRGWLIGDSNKPETLRFLSSKVFSCNGTTCSDTVVRTTYMKYDLEETIGITFDPKAQNPRVQAQRTVFEDDSCGSSPCYTDSASSNFDNLGHYRQTVFTSNIPGTREKTAFTNHTPDSTNWLLGIYDDSWMREGTGSTAIGTRTRASFDPVTGAMTTMRTYRATGPDPAQFAQDSKDLLTAWCRDSVHGFLTSERYFGGDTGSIPSNPCSVSRTANDYFIDHTYTFDGAIVATHKAQYGGTTHFIVDEELDRNTGWAKLVRDSAGVATRYTFDTSGRILSIRPFDGVETHYDYPPATGSPRKIAVRQECPVYDSEFPAPASPAPCATGSLTRQVYYYDTLGRLIQERKQFPSIDSQGVVQTRWSVNWLAYGPLGRKEWASVPTELTSEAFSEPASEVTGTEWTYDHLGRVLTETRPDSTTTSFVYKGDRETKRYVGGQLRSTETFNGLAQLVQVKQRPDSSGDVDAYYGYDAGGRLTTVRMTTPGGATQERLFDYDGRGFLRWESQPEAGMSSYTYDARGHMLSRDQSAARTQFDLRYEYDPAERLEELKARNPFFGTAGQPEFRTFKIFTYGDANGTDGDLRKGKLVTASRYNYGALMGDDVFKIMDTYKYLDGAGRKTHRVTSIIRVGDEYEDVLKNVNQSVVYNALGLPQNMQYPTCTDCGSPSSGPDRSTMAYAYKHGRLQTVTGFVGEMSYWPSGLRRTLEHSNGRTDEQTVGDMPRPSRIAFVPTPVSRCLQPTIVTNPANVNVTSGGNVTLTVTATGTGTFEYQWVRVSDGAFVGPNASSYSINNVTADESYYVIIRNTCGFEQSQVAKVTVGSCVAPTITSVASVRQPDGKWLLKPELSARANATFSWLRMSDSTVIGSTQTVIVQAPGQTTTYRLTVTDSCGNAQYDVTMSPGPVITTTGLVASSTGTLSSPKVTVSWPASTTPNITHYVVERRHGPEWEWLAEPTTNSFEDTNVVAGRTYAYRAYAVRSTAKSNYSNSDIATTGSWTVAVAGQQVSLTPINDMLAAVNSVRKAVGWTTPVTWANILAPSDPLPEPLQPISARHVMSARARMNEALSALGVPLAPYTDATLGGVGIKAVHINEVQQRAQ